MKEPSKSKRNTSRGAFLDAGVMGGYKSNFAGRTGKNAPPELAPQRYVPKEKRETMPKTKTRPIDKECPKCKAAPQSPCIGTKFRGTLHFERLHGNNNDG